MCYEKNFRGGFLNFSKKDLFEASWGVSEAICLFLFYIFDYWGPYGIYDEWYDWGLRGKFWIYTWIVDVLVNLAFRGGGYSATSGTVESVV